MCHSRKKRIGQFFYIRYWSVSRIRRNRKFLFTLPISILHADVIICLRECRARPFNVNWNQTLGRPYTFWHDHAYIQLYVRCSLPRRSILNDNMAMCNLLGITRISASRWGREFSHLVTIKQNMFCSLTLTALTNEEDRFTWSASSGVEWFALMNMNVPGQRCNPNIVRVSRLSERPD